MDMPKFSALLLIVGGALHTIPTLNETFAGFFGGTPLVQILLGLVSIVIGAYILLKKIAFS